MKILGISGLDRSMPFKRLHWPGLDERECRISQGHDSAAALVVDGEIVAAAAEERFSRRKHTGAFPCGAIEYVLSAGGIRPGDLDEVAHGFDYTPYRAAFSLDPLSRQRFDDVYSREALLEQVASFLPGVAPERVHGVSHHLAHAASAHLTSGWDECLVLVVDGMGEVHGASAYRARGGCLDTLGTISARDSIGILYSLVTLHLGFDFNADEYKIMGLAPYGDPDRYRDFFDEAVLLEEGGSLRIPLLHLGTSSDERENHLPARAHLSEHLIPPRDAGDEVQDAHKDVAAALQACLDRAMLHFAGHYAESTGLRRVAMAGGVALNCTTNGALRRSGIFDEMYIQPAAGDDGSALGAALYRASRSERVANRRMPVPFLGPAPTPADLASAIDDRRTLVIASSFSSLDATVREAARRISGGQVVAWYRGAMEFGPRALGHRSIVADPSHPGMRDRVNAKVKMRESFRPFAPAVTVEDAHRWFDVEAGTELPYMLTIVHVRPEHRAELPAITHVDGTARIQTVAATDNPAFHALLRAVEECTGRPMVLNTSFNVKGQPVVNTPLEAIDTFLGTDLDCLFLENTLITRAGPGAAHAVRI